MNKMMKTMAATCMVLLIMSACRKGNNPHELDNYPNTIVLAWNEVAYNVFGGTGYQHSLMASRINAMTHIAMHDALNAIYPKYKTYAFNGSDKKADVIAAAATAAYTVLFNQIPEKKSTLDSALQISLSYVQEGDAKTRGIEIGKQAAQAIINLRANDGSAHDPVGAIPPSQVPGVYQPVPPFNFLFAPLWQHVPSFGLASNSQFRVAPQPALNSVAYATAFNEVKQVGKLNSATRTADQLAYARFWYEFSEAGWNRVARTVASNKKLKLFETARLFALVDIALADAYIAGWDSKTHYNFWRPYTAIRHAAADGNDATAPDASWEPELPTPPVQDYPSTHSALGNAAATVMARLLGDKTAFTMPSPTAVPAGSTRSFTSFSQAANENADSRVMAGIHFRFACNAGLSLGDKIGNWTVDKHLLPVK